MPAEEDEPRAEQARSRGRTETRDALVDLVGRVSTWPGLPVPARSARPAAVLVLIGVLDTAPARHRHRLVPPGLDVLLVARADTLTHHAGQISFPGGRVDAGDAGPEEAALREAVEETGLDPAGVEVLGTLGELPLPVSDHRVTPVLAWWRQRSHVRAVDAGESAQVFRAPVADLLDPANRRTVTVARGGSTYRSPGFLLGDHLVWGLTGLVLDRVFDELGWTEPWDRARTTVAG